VGSIVADGCIDSQQNARGVFQNVVIPEPQDTIALGDQIGRPPIIGSIIGMLPAIEFDNNSEPMTGEVGEVRTHRSLAPKVMFLEWRLT
jgi:hypothetical protein